MQEQGWLLPDGFFEENPLEFKMTAGQLTQFQMDTIFDTTVNDKITDIVTASFDKDREANYRAELAAIEALSSPEEVVRFMRKKIEIASRDVLCRKGASMGKELADLLIDKLWTNGIDMFIEEAMLILSRAEEKSIDRVAREFRQFRNAYARVQATVLLAYRKRMDALGDIFNEYTELSRSNDPEMQRLSRSALFSIYSLCGRVGDIENE